MASTKQEGRHAAKATAATGALTIIKPQAGLQKANGRSAAVYLARLGPGDGGRGVLGSGGEQRKRHKKGRISPRFTFSDLWVCT